MSEQSTLPPTKAMIGKWSVDRYIALIRRWVIGSAILIILLVLTSQPRLFVTIVEVLIIIGVSWLVVQQGGGKVESLAAGAFVGVAFGIASSVSHVILVPTLANSLGIIIETLITTVVSMVLSVCVNLLLNLTKQRQH